MGFFDAEKNGIGKTHEDEKKQMCETKKCTVCEKKYPQSSKTLISLQSHGVSRS